MKKCVCGRNVACDGSCCEPEEVLEEPDQDDIIIDLGEQEFASNETNTKTIQPDFCFSGADSKSL